MEPLEPLGPLKLANEKNNKPSFLLAVIFWALLGVFVFMIGQFFIPPVRELFMGSELFLVPFIVFCLLGLVLIFLTVRGKKTGLLKKFLLLTGISAAGFFVSVFLHNAFYALAIVTDQIIVLSYLMEILNVAFFLIGIFVCPLGFLTGVVGSIFLFIKERKK
jgi:hypothetical protein